jgi:hypothetical protein
MVVNKLQVATLVTVCVLAATASVYAIIKEKDTFPGIPRKKNLNVPFTTQAPKQDWHEPWLNACEETSIIMADNFYKDKKISPEQARQQILKVLEIKEQNFGKSKDESMERVAEIINLANLNWTAHVSVNPLLNDIKKELAENRPVIAPVDPRLLKNAPYDTSLKYHVLVISGYDDDKNQFIVQDPGTKGGKNDRYGYDNFYKAINDFLPNASPSGRKAVLFTAPK